MKKLLSLAITICLLCGLLVNVSAVSYGEELKNAPVKSYEQKFSDVPENHWAFNYISEMSERGVLSGYPDGKFYPDSQVTRAEFAKIMTTAAGLSVTQPATQLFADVQLTQWYAPYVHTAKEYLSAYSQGGASYYLPNTPALREDIAVALVKLKGYSTTGADLSMLERMFSDYQSISDNAKIYVATAIENGLISGYNDGTFKGQNSITRAEAATLLWRAYQYGNSNKNYDNISEISNTGTINDNKKPYIMRQLVPASIDNIAMATMDNYNNIYYIDNTDNAVYKINVFERNSSKYFETKELSYEETRVKESDDETEITVKMKYSSFVPTQVFYNNLTESLLLVGYYEKLIESFGAPQIGIYNAVYDITYPGSYSGTVYYELDNTTENYWNSYDKTSQFTIQLPFNKNSVYISGYEWYRGEHFEPHVTADILNLNTGKLTRTGLYFDADETNALKCNNNIYSLQTGLRYSQSICKYNFNTEKNEKIVDDIYYSKYGIKDNYYYFQALWKTGPSYFKLSVDTGEVTELDITDNEGRNGNVYGEEKTIYENISSWNNIQDKFFVIDDSTLIFYDEGLEQFIILEKN